MQFNILSNAFMLRFLKPLVGVLTLGVVCQQASAFSMYGTPYTWQVTALGYDDASLLVRNLGDEYRINTPIVTYGFDSSFVDYFGEDGIKAVDEAFQLMNNLPAASKMTTNLTEFLLSGDLQINQTAESLYLLDMKSATLSMILAHLGLAPSERNVFDLRFRIAVVNLTCTYNYGVVLRNFDPITWEPSEYINGTRYTYRILENGDCSAADAYENPVSVHTANDVNPPASSILNFITYGSYYLGLTRDDAGGLRYLYSPKNYNFELLPNDALISSQQASIPTTWTAVSTNDTVSSEILSNSIWMVPPTGATNTTSTTTTTSSAVTTDSTTTSGSSTNTAYVRGGVNKVRFLKMTPVNSLIGTNYHPLTVSFTVPVLSTNKLITQKITRTITSPDIVIAAADLTSDATGIVIYDRLYYYVSSTDSSTTSTSSTSTSSTTSTDTTDVGPGVFDPRGRFTFNKSGPILINLGSGSDYFLNEASASHDYSWGKYDGTTNTPIVFPSGTSIKNLKNHYYSGSSN